MWQLALVPIGLLLFHLGSRPVEAHPHLHEHRLPERLQHARLRPDLGAANQRDGPWDSAPAQVSEIIRAAEAEGTV